MQDHDIRVLGPGDEAVLTGAPDGLFDNAVPVERARRFLSDPGHLIVVAQHESAAIGFASGTILLHPDKQDSLFINEVSVIAHHRRRGVGRAVVRALLDAAHLRHGCTEAWLGTETDNIPALALYRSMAADEQVCAVFAWGFRWADQ